jgi:hypothetical protein
MPRGAQPPQAPRWPLALRQPHLQRGQGLFRSSRRQKPVVQLRRQHYRMPRPDRQTSGERDPEPTQQRARSVAAWVGAAGATSLSISSSTAAPTLSPPISRARSLSGSKPAQRADPSTPRRLLIVGGGTVGPKVPAGNASWNVWRRATSRSWVQPTEWVNTRPRTLLKSRVYWLALRLLDASYEDCLTAALIRLASCSSGIARHKTAPARSRLSMCRAAYRKNTSLPRRRARLFRHKAHRDS